MSMVTDGWSERVDQRRGDGGGVMTDGLKQALCEVPLLLLSSSLGLRPMPSKACVGGVCRGRGLREARLGLGWSFGPLVARSLFFLH
jgi:hypothetical protein